MLKASMGGLIGILPIDATAMHNHRSHHDKAEKIKQKVGFDGFAHATMAFTF